MNEFRRRTARELAELYVDDDGSNEVRLVVALGTFLNGERAFKTTMSGGQAAYGDECIHQQEIHIHRERGFAHAGCVQWSLRCLSNR